MKDYYKILGISPDTPQDYIRKAYYERAKVYHPDCGGSNEAMKEITEAYEILKDPIKRAKHDQSRSPNATNETIKANYKNQQYAQSVSNNYPKQWETFKQWFYKDFKEADYTPKGSVGSGPNKINVPTGGDSLSAQAFIYIGGAAGILLSFFLVGFPSNKSHTLLYTGLMAGGAWAGAGIHRNISDGL